MSNVPSEASSVYADLEGGDPKQPDKAEIRALFVTVGEELDSGNALVTTSTPGQMSAADKTKLNGIQNAATANSTDAELRARSSHTGTQSADTITDGTTNKVYTATEKTKLFGIASGATANDTDANLKNRGNHTGVQAISTVTGLQTALDGKASTALVTTSDPGLMSAADKTKLNGVETGATANATDAALRARASHTGTQSADTITDGTTNKAYTATEKTKLAGIATGATANDTDANLRARASHTGTQSADTIVDGTTNKAFTATEKTKLAGVATGATANDTDANLKARANHTGTQSADTITDGTTNKAYTAVEKTKLAGIATGATANDTDANLKARANHTGTQAASTVDGLPAALAALDIAEDDIAQLKTTAPYFGGTVIDEDGRIWDEATINHETGRIVAGRIGGDSYLLVGNVLSKVGGEGDAPVWIRSGSTTRKWLSGTDLIILVDGQSNGNGYVADGSAILAGTALYPTQALMLNTGLRYEVSHSPASLVPLVEAIGSPTTLRETLCSGLANHLIEMLDDAGITDVRIICVVAAQNGTNLNEIDEGSPAWLRKVGGVSAAARLSVAEGRKPVAVVVDRHGESDNALLDWQYRQHKRAYVRDLAVTLRAVTSQTVPVKYFTIQPDGGTTNDPNASTWMAPGPALAFEQLHGVDDIRLIGPAYPFPFGDSLHHTCTGHNRSGTAAAAAIFEEYAGEGWTPLMAGGDRGGWTGALQLDVQFIVPRGGALVLDTTGDIDVTDMISTQGFQAVTDRNDLLTISSVDLLPWGDGGYPTQKLRFTFAAVTDGDVTLHIGQRRNDSADGGGNHGPITGGRTCLRGSVGVANLYESGRVVYPWQVIQQINVGRP
jgi:hypothetical protein